jgi:hypothetical protein
MLPGDIRAVTAQKISDIEGGDLSGEQPHRENDAVAPQRGPRI